MINDLLGPGVFSRLDPGIYGERTRRVKICAISYADVIRRSIEAERLAHFAGGKRRAPLQRTIMAPLYVLGVTIAGPPTHHIVWRRGARPAFARAARAVKALNIPEGERAVEDLELVNDTIEITRARAGIQRVMANEEPTRVGNASDAGCAHCLLEHSVEVNRHIVAGAINHHGEQMEISVGNRRGSLDASRVSPILDGEAQRACVIKAQDVAGSRRIHE